MRTTMSGDHRWRRRRWIVVLRRTDLVQLRETLAAGGAAPADHLKPRHRSGQPLSAQFPYDESFVEARRGLVSEWQRRAIAVLQRSPDTARDLGAALAAFDPTIQDITPA